MGFSTVHENVKMPQERIFLSSVHHQRRESIKRFNLFESRERHWLKLASLKPLLALPSMIQRENHRHMTVHSKYSR